MSNIAKQQKKSVNALLHAEFKRIKKLALSAVEQGVQPADSGICYMIKDELYDLFKGDLSASSPRSRAFDAWPKTSGNQHYPILLRDVEGISKEDAAKAEYRSSRGMRWSGKYLEARLDLLDHLIEYFKPPVMPRTALLKLLRVDMQAEGYTHRGGICGAILHNLPYAAHIVCGEARRAISPKNYVYPVELKGEKGGISFSRHAKHGTLWVGEYGAARKVYALKIADYVEDNYTVKLNKKVNTGSREQQLFRKVIKAGYYSFSEFGYYSARFMCHAVAYACRAGVVTTEEKELLDNSINTYLRGGSVLINELHHARIISSEKFANKQNQKVLLNIYMNWDKRPELKG